MAIVLRVSSEITSSSVANPSVITCPDHGFTTGQSVTIVNHSGATPNINGTHTVTAIDADTFSIPVNVTVGGANGYAMGAREWRQGSLHIETALNAVDRLALDVYSLDGLFRAKPDAIVEFEENSVLIFAGRIVESLEVWAKDKTWTGIANKINALSHAQELLWRRVNETIPGGTTETILQYLVDNYLDDYGGTLAGGQQALETLEDIVGNNRTIKDILDEIAQLNEGAVWEYSPSRVLEMFLAGDRTAGVNITNNDGVVIGDLRVRNLQNANFANVVKLLIGQGTALQTQTWTADGVVTTFDTDLPADPAFEINKVTRIVDIVSSSVAASTVITTLQNHGLLTGDRVMIQGHSGSTPNINSLVDRRVTRLSATTFSLDGLTVSVGGTGGEMWDSVPLGVRTAQRIAEGASSPFKWQWNPIESQGPEGYGRIYQRTGDTPAPDDTRVRLKYNALYPFMITVEDAASIAAKGRREVLVARPDIFSAAQGQTAAEAELARRLLQMKQAEYATYETDILVGDVQTITNAKRRLSIASSLITGVSISDPGRSDGQLLRSVRGLVSTSAQPSWQQLYKDWLGGGLSVTSSASGGASSTVTELDGGFSIEGQDREMLYIDGDTPRGGKGAHYLKNPNASATVNPLFNFSENLPAKVAIEAVDNGDDGSGVADEDQYALALWNTTAGRSRALTFRCYSDGETWITQDANGGGGHFAIGALGSLLGLNGKGVYIAPGSITLSEMLELQGLSGLGCTALMRRRETATFTITATTTDRLTYLLDSSSAQTVNLPALANFGVDTATSDTSGYGRLFIFHNIGTATWTLDPNSTETIGPASATTYPVLPGGTVIIMGWRGTGSKWLVLSESGGSTTTGLRVARVVLTDAQTKALPTTPVDLVAAPGTDFTVELLKATLVSKTAGGAYTNINAAGYLQLAFASGTGVSSYLPNDAAITAGSATRLSDLLGTTTPTRAHLLPYMDTEDVNQWGALPTVHALSGANNSALQIAINNNGGGNLTGGNAANTLTATVYYTVQAV